MLSFEIGKITIDFMPLVSFFVIAIPVMLISYLLKKNQARSMINYCCSGEYEKSLAIADKLLNYHSTGYKIFRFKKVKSNIDIILLWRAISYLGLSRYDDFFDCIDKIETKKNYAYGWMGIYYVIKRDVEQVKICIEKIEPDDDLTKTVNLLNGFVLCLDDKMDEGAAILNNIDTKYALIKQLISDFTKQ